ncbi:MAG: hypothetical protein NZL91_06610 [Thermoflexales bacterium]|nr:hypothetical protein [Thermoflexales bacterium]MCX7939023.1 hypothetical protein [Thermoflexales bacterium]MDW8291849.1 TCP-1/cpn60 chaperonin family protein [Anaerolineae bacterium]
MRTPSQTSFPRRPAVIFEREALVRGFDALAELVKPTLGPLARVVLIEGLTRDRTPEVLDHAAAIARRLIELPHPTADVGAMMLRHALWRMHEICGDGAATTAVIAQSIVHEGMRAIAAGASPVRVRVGIERGVALAVEALRRLTEPAPLGARRRAWLEGLAAAATPDVELRQALVELVYVLGDDAYINIYNNDPNRIEYEFLEGALWDAPWLGGGFTADPTDRVARLQNAAVIVLDGLLDTAANTIMLLQKLEAMGYRAAAIIASDLTDEARTVLLQAKHRGLFHPLPIKTPYGGDKRAVALHDIALLTGGRVLFSDKMPFAQKLSREDVGEARRVWANAKQFGIIAGRRDVQRLRQTIAGIRRQLETTTDSSTFDDLLRRLGQLSGSMGILRIGAPTQRVQEARRDTAARLARVMQLALRSGVVAGGGAALLKASMSIPTASNDDVGWGMRCVVRALEAPMRTLVANAGMDASASLHAAREANREGEAAFGFDVRSGALVDLARAGVVDALEVVENAVRVAGSLAAQVLTTEVVVHHRKPQSAAYP